jgi:acyl carrier protein
MQEASSTMLHFGQQDGGYLFDLFARIREIICIEWGLVALDVRPESHLFKDFGADPQSMIEVAMAMEEEFNIAISDEQLEHVETVSDLSRLADGLTKF